jgi:hypothetical protein
LVELGHFFQHLDARLNHLGLGSLGAKSVDKCLGVGALAIFVRSSLFVDFVVQDDLRVSLGGAAFELAYFLTMDHRGMRCNAVHKITIMGNHNQLAVKLGKKSGDPSNRGDVEVIGRLVEQK